jgi:hypothetical protein
MVLGVQPFADRTDDGGPRLDDGAEEEVMRVERGVAIALGRRPPESSGTLYITTRYNYLYLKILNQGVTEALVVVLAKIIEKLSPCCALVIWFV